MIYTSTLKTNVRTEKSLVENPYGILWDVRMGVHETAKKKNVKKNHM